MTTRRHGLVSDAQADRTLDGRSVESQSLIGEAVTRRRYAALGRRLGFDLVSYSAKDMRIIVRAISVLFVWKWLSVDFAALPRLVHGPPLVTVGWPGSWFVELCQRAVLTNLWTVRAVQVAAAVAILAGAFLLRRWLMLLGVVLVLALLVAASPYNGAIYDVEQPAVLLLIVAFWPRSWSLFKGDGRVSGGATLLGICLATYIGLGYFLAGLSKLEFDSLWFEHVRLDLLYPAMTVWHSTVLPWWLNDSASYIHGVFAAHQLLAESAAIAALCGELLWPLAIVTRPGRYVLPPLMAGTHLMIFLSSGIFFGMMALLGLVVIWTPLIRKLWQRRTGQPAEDRAPQRPVIDVGLLVPAVTAVSLLVLLPAIYQTSYHVPFANYRQFGWSYGTVAQPTMEYRFGVLDGRSRRPEPFPMNYGGFLDYRMVASPDGLIAAYLATPLSPSRAAYAQDLLQYLKAIRPYESRRWLLGPLAFPDHIVAKSQRVNPQTFRNIFLIQRRFIYSNGRLLDTPWVNRGLIASRREGAFVLSGDSSRRALRQASRPKTAA